MDGRGGKRKGRRDGRRDMRKAQEGSLCHRYSRTMSLHGCESTCAMLPW